MKLLLASIAIVLVTTLPLQGKTHLLAVVDRHANEIGYECSQSYEGLKEFLKLARGDEHRDDLVILEFPEQAVPSPDSILNYYRTNSFDESDVIWFYYCGHGATDPARGHFMKMSSGDLSRSKLREAMESRGTKGVVIITDCCSSPAPLKTFEPMAQEPAIPPRDHWAVLSSLFAATEGTVDITAASGTAPAFVDPGVGTVFTEALTATLSLDFKSLDSDADGKILWEEVFALLREQTRSNFQTMASRLEMDGTEVESGATDQVPFAFSLRPALAALEDSAFEVISFTQRIAYGEGDAYRQFLIRMRFGKKYAGHAMTFKIMYLNEDGERVVSETGEPFEDALSVTIDTESSSPNDNSPWIISIPRREPLEATSDLENRRPIVVQLDVRDATGGTELCSVRRLLKVDEY